MRTLPLLALLLAGPALGMGRRPPRATDLEVRDAAALVERSRGRKDFVILDVRTPAEFAEGRIAGAVNLDFNAPNFKREVVKLDKSKTYLVHCAKGRRSDMSEKLMKEAGFERVYDMLGGMQAWRDAGLPVEK